MMNFIGRFGAQEEENPKYSENGEFPGIL